MPQPSGPAAYVFLFFAFPILAFVALHCQRTVLGLRLKRIGRELVIEDDNG